MNGLHERNDRSKRTERLEYLAERWLEAAATEAEERELRDLLQEGALPESLRGLARLFEGFGALAAEKMPGNDALPAVERTAPALREIRSRRRPLIWGAAVAATVALGLLLGVELLRKPYCYIDGRAVYDREVAMQTTAYFDSFAALDTPSRLVDELLETE